MPKIKTSRAAAKRFKLTGTGLPTNGKILTTNINGDASYTVQNNGYINFGDLTISGSQFQLNAANAEANTSPVP